MAKRVISNVELHHWQGTWYTTNGRFQIAPEGRAVSRCGTPHLTRNGMMCQGDQWHATNAWWVWDSIARNHVFGNRCFDTLSQAVGELVIKIEQGDV